MGTSEYLKHHDDKKVEQAVVKYLEKTFDHNGQWREKPKHVDGAILAYALMKLSFVETDRYKEALDYTWAMIKEYIGEDGTVEYRKSMNHYRYVDTVGFICPFLVAYGLRYEEDACIDLSIKQILTYERYGMLTNHGIPCHAYLIDHKVPMGLYGWGRGLGWYAIGLIDAWYELPTEHPYKSELKHCISRFAKAAIRFQQPSGNWNWTVTRQESIPDSSSTATVGWFMQQAASIPALADECSASAERAIHYLMKVTRRNGAIDFSQGDTKDIGVYSNQFGILPFTQGFGVRLIQRYNAARKSGKQEYAAKKEGLNESKELAH
ncbi:glycoside hydrolase family 88 protein [Paenibacillus spongiae]|uniref:Glycoside hydrolase family 88 protein n=1 Tax=Paenibacillus spongiae TaxID=2909671 RepID=A0ABY5SDC4_9BACL|nr:glycoside hydrolase family 88 protein [Paenibacillus spongiae]